MNKVKKIFSVLLTFVLCFSLLVPMNVNAETNIRLNKTKATLYVGKTVNLNVKNVKNDLEVNWTSSNKKVATVNKYGKVTTKKKGTTKITATIGDEILTCKITVKNPYLNKTKVTLKKNKTTKLKLTGANVKKWTSSDKTIATVNQNGKITAKKKGTVTISGKASNGKTYKCKVTVKAKETSDGYIHHYKPTDEGYEILNAYDIAFQKAGMKYFPDTDLYKNYPEAGPSGGMGWGEAILYPGESLEEQVQSSVKAAQMDCIKYYYLEYMGELKSGGISVIVFTSQ